jgi:hypothetical protein
MEISTLYTEEIAGNLNDRQYKGAPGAGRAQSNNARGAGSRNGFQRDGRIGTSIKQNQSRN